MMKGPLYFVALLGLALAFAACGSSEPKTTTVVTVIKETPPSSASAGSQDDAATGRTGSDGDGIVSDEGAGGDSPSGKITVPDEVGKQHQAAQDDLQAHGLYVLAEEDATGQHRFLINDRNWKVVSQSPAAGTKVSEDATITLKSKKYTDP
jgi:hypothetical protein